jgi:hypothetical protein
MSRGLWVSVLVAVAAVGLVLYRRGGGGGGGSDSEPALSMEGIPTYALTKQIPHLADSYLGLRKSGAAGDFPEGWNRPAIFKNGVNTKKWLAGKVLTNEGFWKQELWHVPHVGVSPDGLFSYFKMDRPLSRVVATRESPHSTPRRNMSASELFRLWRSEKDEDERIAFSEVLHKLPLASGKSADEVLWPLVFPFDPFLVNDTRPTEDGNETFASAEKATFRLWMASAGSRTWAHHDWSHNWHVMLAGQKRFVLYPPSSIPDLSLYGFLHPHATKSQIDLLSLESCRSFPRFMQRALGKGREAIVEAGDVLYIPPFWIHDVFTIQPAMSIAVWSPSRDNGLSDALIELGLPVADRKASLRRQLRIVCLWLGALLDAGLPGDEQAAGALVRDDLLEGRYGGRVRSTVAAVRGDWKVENCPPPEARLGRLVRARAVIAAPVLERALSLVGKMTPDARPLVLGNYVEIALHEFIHSEPELIVTMLDCLADFLSG